MQKMDKTFIKILDIYTEILFIFKKNIIYQERRKTWLRIISSNGYWFASLFHF